MRESINEIVDCIERKIINVHAKNFDVSPILSFQQGFYNTISEFRGTSQKG